jgi:hypothetical protein
MHIRDLLRVRDFIHFRDIWVVRDVSALWYISK